MSTAFAVDRERREQRAAFAAWAEAHVAPHAAACDRDGTMVPALLGALRESGYPGATVGEEHGGAGLDDLAFGLLCAEVGRHCASTRSLLTVSNMVAHAIQRWGTREQRRRWLPGLGSGGTLAAFCLTEPEVGSDAGAVRTELAERDGGWSVTGRKRWVTGGLVADLFLVIGRAPAGPTAVLVERGAAGLAVAPVAERMLGLRAAMLADVDLDGCHVPREATLGPPGLGFLQVANSALDHARHGIAWGCAGIAEACVGLAAAHALIRRQFGAPLADQQLVRRMLTRMTVDARAARLLCEAAAVARAAREPEGDLQTMTAKYFAAHAAWRAASHAVEILGGLGCSDRSPAERHLRDARVMRIVEGTDEIHELAICELALREASRP
ncbi:MAG TPA: acyl-CoA dehydrogenase family protein [Candidatus Dormibacteraeota bacterium]|nr:acyl-CoA dehydrogenase family protein [Candidatus Dormibacteraeota bacterium]